jgi:hypothetical protein
VTRFPSPTAKLPTSANGMLQQSPLSADCRFDAFADEAWRGCLLVPKTTTYMQGDVRPDAPRGDRSTRTLGSFDSRA